MKLERKREREKKRAAAERKRPRVHHASSQPLRWSEIKNRSLPGRMKFVSRTTPYAPLRYHYRARNWTFDENNFWFLLKRTFWWKLCEKFSGEVGIKCTVALVFCTKFYIKLAVCLSSFSQFSIPFNFQTAIALVLKFGTLPLRCLFSNILLAIFDIFFPSKVIHRYVPSNVPKMTCGRVFQHNFISKANLKNPEQDFLVNRFYLLSKQKDCLWQGRFS